MRNLFHRARRSIIASLFNQLDLNLSSGLQEPKAPYSKCNKVGNFRVSTQFGTKGYDFKELLYALLIF